MTGAGSPPPQTAPANGLPAYALPPTGGTRSGLPPFGSTPAPPNSGPRDPRPPGAGNDFGRPSSDGPISSGASGDGPDDFGPQYGSADGEQYGTVDGPRYGTTNGPQYGTADRPQYGTVDGPQYGTINGAQHGSPGGPQPHPAPDTPFGVTGPGHPHQPFGARVSSPTARSTPGASAPSGAVPQQRGQGTVYGGAPGYSAIEMTMPVSSNPVENSGSLTGHILAQGWDRGVDTNRRSNIKVAVAMLVVLVVLIGISVLFLFTAGDAFTDMLNGVFQG